MAEETLDVQEAFAGSGLAHERVEAILEAVETGDQERLVGLLEPLHEADIADLLEQVSRADRRALILLWGVDLDGSVLTELEEGVRDEVLEELPDEVLAAAVQDLESDDVVYLAEDLDEPQQERLPQPHLKEPRWLLQ